MMTGAESEFEQQTGAAADEVAAAGRGAGQTIPEPVVRRLPLYLRVLGQMEAAGATRVSSRELAAASDLGAALVRRDLSWFGHFGVPHVGYYVKDLRREIRRILGLDREVRGLLVGTGHLGEALLAYYGSREEAFRIVAAVDADPAKVGTRRGTLAIESAAALDTLAARERIDLAILAVPAAAAQDVATRLARAGVRAILNFAPVRLEVPAGVRVQQVDLAIEIETLAYYLR